MDHCTYCRNIGQAARCTVCQANYCSTQCRDDDRYHFGACYSVPLAVEDGIDVVDVVDVAKALSGACCHDSSRSYILSKQIKNQEQLCWKAQPVDQPVTDWKMFCPKKILSKDSRHDRHLRYCMFHKASTTHSDQTVVDLVSILLLLRKGGATLTIYGIPVVSLFYCTMDMKKSRFSFFNPYVIHQKKPLILMNDWSAHLLLGVKTEDSTMPVFALDIMMPPFDMYSFAANGCPLFLVPLSVYGTEAVKSVQLVKESELAKVRNHVDYGTDEIKNMRKKHVSDILCQYKYKSV